MASLVLALVGIAFLGLGWLLLRSFGDGLRIGRLLRAAPQVGIDEAVKMAHRGERAYVRLTGRIDAPEPFVDEHRRPLVLRRERIEVREGERWRRLAEASRHVPFVLRDRMAEIAIDAAALDRGLVVIPRESEGRAGEVADHFETPVDPALRVRFRIDQVSAVEHAFAAGVPTIGPGGTAMLGPGDGRPLILTTLEIDEAMRVLARGRRQRATLTAGLLVAGLACLAVALIVSVLPLLLPTAALGASPSPTIAPGGDTRSSGEGPGLVGQPLVIAFGVVLLGLASAGVAVLYARLTRSR
ncbi:MAG TPA: hypothetical protein VJ141_05000 [Candidatus Limnocylindrales bacterium]|nr:hypothetical protein [Candidatus Limnocylindrales bacterium]